LVCSGSIGVGGRSPSLRIISFGISKTMLP
jgi:hypothetical protein